MRKLVTLLMLSAMAACGQNKSGAPTAGSAAPSPPPTPPVALAVDAGSDGSDEVAQLVVEAVASKALGNQSIEASCVAVSLVPAGKWTVASARLKDCGNKTARSIVWLYKRPDHGKWNEDYEGQPPRCWKGVPADIAPAVAQATRIPAC